MSNIKRKQTNSPISKDKTPHATVVISIIVAIIALVTGYNWGYYQGNQKSIDLINQQTPSGLIVTEDDDDTGNIYSYQGTVSEISGNLITMTAKVNENGVQLDKLISVNTEENTTYRKIDISIPPVDTEDLEPGVENPREKTIQLNDIQIGDNIVADASENIFGKTSFQAYQLTVLSLGL
jgi:hypothetical protein